MFKYYSRYKKCNWWGGGSSQRPDVDMDIHKVQDELEKIFQGDKNLYELFPLGFERYFLEYQKLKTEELLLPGTIDYLITQHLYREKNISFRRRKRKNYFGKL